MKKRLCFMILAWAAAMLPAKVPLSQAVIHAWELSPGLDNQRLEGDAAAIARLTALRQKNFSIYFNGSYRYSSDKVQVTMSDFPFQLSPDIFPGAIVLSAPNDSIDLKMSLLQPIYSGGLLSNAVRMGTLREAAERDLARLKKLELAGAVKNSFFTHRLLCKKRDALNSLLDILKLHQEKLENLYREELLKKSDLLETRTKADEIRLNLEDLEQSIRSEALHFSMLCGFEPQDIEYQTEAGMESLTAAREFFLANHPLLRSLTEKARIIQLQKKSIAAAYLPQVSLVAELHYGRPGQNFFVNQWTTYVAGGINVSLPVFNWNKGGRDRSLADIAARQLENQRADFVRESERNLQQLFFYRDSLQKKLALLDGLVANAAEDAGLKEKLYAENQINHHDYLAALTSQERYHSNREELLARIELLKVGIHTLIGKCEEER